jgi:hypothetical protein
MRKIIILSCLLIPIFIPQAPAAIYTGGSGSGWSYYQITPAMYHGGQGDGDCVGSLSTDTAVGYGTATNLTFSISPSESRAGVAFGTQPVVRLRDASNNYVLSGTNTISLSIVDPQGASLGGTTSMSAVAGIADFSGKGLYVSRAGSNFMLSAASSGLTSATSSAFDITSPMEMTSPNGGEVWVVSTAYDVTWNTYGSLVTGTNTVDYSLNNGSSWTTISTNATSPLSWVTPTSTSTQCLVRVTNSADATYTDTSDATFRIGGGFTVVAPNGGETWANAVTHSIQWQTSGTISNVKLEYYDGSSWTTIIASTPNTGEYSWTPNVSSGGTGFKIRVSDASDTAVKDESNSAFTLQKVSVTAPTSGQRVRAGTSTNITWVAAGISNVKIEYSVNDGSWTEITASTLASTGTYGWSVPSSFTTSNNVKVRISSTTSDSDGNTASNTSSAFAIYGQLTLTAPNGAEAWAANEAHNITWTSDAGTITNVKLEYSADNFVSDVNTIVASVANSGTYSWTPTITGTTFKVRVSDVGDSQTYDISNNYFSITGIGISSPVEGVTWNCGSSHDITWNYTGSFTNVKIEYSTDSGVTWNTIVTSTLNDGTYTWTVANTPTTAAKIRISNASGGTPSATSAAFNIKSVIGVTAPNGGESLTVGDSSGITWSVTGSVSNVKIEYSTDNGSTYTAVTESEGAANDGIVTNDGSFSWTVPDTISSLCLVRISDVDSGHPASSDTSDAVFSIQAGFTITAPAVGVNWAVNESHSITWTNTGTVSNVRLYYATEKDNYATWTEITSGATANSNTYSWTVSDIILAVGQDPQADATLSVKVKVVDATSGHPAAYGASNAFNVIYYTITWVVKDSQSQSNLAALSVTCTSGWSATNQASGVTHKYPYGTYTTIWSKADYTDSSYSDWVADSSKSLTVLMTLSAVAAQEYHVYSNFTYDAASDSYKINAWIEKSGAIVTGPTSVTVSVEDKDGNAVDINGSAAGNNLTSSSPNANGVFRLSWDLTNINRNTSYFGKVQIVYLGVTYSSNITYAITIPTASKVTEVTSLTAPVSAIQTSVGTGLNTAVSSIQTSVGTGLGTKVDALQTDITSVKTAVGAGEGTTLYSKVGEILTDTGTTIPATITSELKKGPRSKILNRPTTVNVGDTVTIRYQTDSGTSPKVTVYDADNNARVSNATMTEIASTGVYEYDVTFASSWGTGDYTIVCSESTTNSLDSMIIKVEAGTTLTSVEAKINTLTTTLNTVNTNISSIKTIIGTTSDTASANTLYGKLSGVSTNISSLADKWGSYSAADIVGYVDKVEEYLGGPNDPCGLLTVFGKIACVYAQTGDVPAITLLVDKARKEVEDLRKEVNFNGKSDTAYSLLDTINKSVTEIRNSVGGIPVTTSEARIKEVAESVKETREILKKAASEAGLKGVAKEETRRFPATLESLQNQLLELKAMTEVIKKSMEAKQEPVVKTWFEPVEKEKTKEKK